MSDGSKSESASPYPAEVIEQKEKIYKLAVEKSQPVRIEDLMQDVSLQDCNDVLVALLLLELELRQPPITPKVASAEFHARFPQHPQAVSNAVGQYEHHAPAGAPLHGEQDIGKYIGKYKIEKLLGAGSFAAVYRAVDSGLDRKVALKVPRNRPPEHDTDPKLPAIEQQKQLEALAKFRDQMNKFRKEAKLLAKFNHPALVRIYDVFDNEHGVPVLVQEFVDGPDLKHYLEQNYWGQNKRVPAAEAVRLITAICEGLKVAHRDEVYHRDLKPANILLDQQRQPKIADFGLALHALERPQREGYLEGTLGYMSPEQLRTENHKIDGRSDLWAIGVMLYEMLAGRRPFRWEKGGSYEEQVRRARQAVQQGQPTPLKQFHDDLPDELYWLCLRCLHPQMEQRTSSAGQLLDELKEIAAHCHPGVPRSFAPPATAAALSPPQDGNGSDGSGSLLAAADSSGSATANGADTEPGSGQSAVPLTVRPQGLLSFTREQQAEFLQLLPGVPDRKGLPPAIAYWRDRIDGIDREVTFAVGLLHGPSGCGKTSLMKAGILPRLPARIHAHYVESTAGDTEVRILKSLRRDLPDLPEKDLPALLQLIREEGHWLAPGHRLLVVLDQFEQWLHSHHNFPQEQLTAALRQCDGRRVQAILMIREDFIPLMERFFRELDVPLDANHNKYPLELFDQQHAEKVLTLYGVAMGKLGPAGAPGPARQQFLKQAIRQLSSPRGEVISVQLALFVEMFGSRDWTPEVLQEVGGAERLGVRFLEDSFRKAEFRPHSARARRVLSALLPPDNSTDSDDNPRIRGAMRSQMELLQAAELQNQPREFEILLEKLEKSLRLITPTTPDSDLNVTADEAKATNGGYFQLTHDYLVPALTEWLTQKQKGTRAGRAELLLEQRTASWRRKQERRQLPSLLESVRIRWYVPRKRWTDEQRQVMQASRNWHSLQSAVVSTAVLLLLTVGLIAYSHTLAESLDNLQLSGLLNVTRDMQPVRLFVQPILQRRQQVANTDRERRKILLARLRLGAVALAEQDQKLLLDQVADCTPADLVSLTALLDSAQQELKEPLRSLFSQQTTSSETRLHTACVLAGWESSSDPDALWNQPETASFVQSQLFAIAPENPTAIPHYERALHNQADRWVRNVVDSIVATPVSDSVPSAVWTLLENNEQLALAYLKQLDEKDYTWLPSQRDVELARKSAVRTAMLKLSAAAFDVSFLADSANPACRNLILHRLPRFEVDADDLTEKLPTVTDPGVRRSLIQGLGELSDDRKQNLKHNSDLIGTLKKEYSAAGDPGVHSAAGWTLRKLGVQTPPQMPVNNRTADTERLGLRLETFNDFSMEFVVIDARGETKVTETDTLRLPFDIGRRYMIGVFEVTTEQYKPFSNLAKRPGLNLHNKAPVSISWHDATRYCNWLSELAGIAQSQWCYESAGVFDEFKLELMREKPNCCELTGYRLPTEAEWEYACRGGTTTEYSCGDHPELLVNYGWYNVNSIVKEGPFTVGQLRPNAYGLFDVHGNESEWCHDNLDHEEGIRRVVRGGCHYSDAANVGSASGLFLDLVRLPFPFSGFRVSKTYP